MLLRVHGRDRVVERTRLLVEREKLSAEHGDPGGESLELPREIGTAQAEHFVGGLRKCLQPGDQAGRLRRDLRQRALRRVGLALPLGRSVKRVDVVLVVRSDGEHQLDVPLRNGVHLPETIGDRRGGRGAAGCDGEAERAESAEEREAAVSEHSKELIEDG